MHRFFTALISLILVCTFSFTTVAQSPDKILKQATKAMTNGSGEKALR